MTGRCLSRRLLFALAGALTLGAAGAGAAYSLGPALSATPSTTARVVRAASPTAVRSRGPAPTPQPLPRAGTVTRAGAPAVPVEVDVPFVGGAWPVGIFVVGTRRGPAKQAGYQTFSVDLGVLNEAAQPLTIATAGQYKEAISLYAGGHWKGLFFVAFHTAAGKDSLPSDGSGAADLPPGVWDQTHLQVDLPQGEGEPELRIGVRADSMVAASLASLTFKPQGQPWAAPGLAPTAVAVSPAPGAAPAARPAP